MQHILLTADGSYETEKKEKKMSSATDFAWCFKG